MSEFLFYYERVSPTTWAYLSSLLTIGLFFKFSRFWSVRNLDLLLLILLAPGLLLIRFGGQIHELETILAVSQESTPQTAHVGEDGTLTRDVPHGVSDSPDDRAPSREPSGGPASGLDSSSPVASASVTPQSAPPSDTAQQVQKGRSVVWLGYIWLFSAGGVLLIRLLVDSMMVRRPLLTPNLSVGGLTFIGCSLFVFLMANVVTSGMNSRPSAQLASVASVSDKDGELFAIEETVSSSGPGYAVLNRLPHTATTALAIASHLVIVLGMTLIGYRHFGNITMGIGAATLYLMLPYTEQTTGQLDHAIPAAFLVLAVLCYRQPLAAGCFLGLASGVVYYPLFLLPLWISFYWQRGYVRLIIGVVFSLVVMAAVLVLDPGEAGFWPEVRRMFGLWFLKMDGLDGIWDPSSGGWDPQYRLPVLAAFIALCGGLSLWPAQKNLGTLLSCSAAVMLATQFWHGFGGGTYMNWYLPLALMTIFRPNLEDRVALSVLGQGWFPRRRTQLASVEKAA